MMRRRETRAALLAMLLCMGSSLAYAFGKTERGTSGATFLKIPVGARPAAMGEAYSAIGDDVYSIFYNPAGLAGLRHVEFAGMRNDHFQDTSHHFGAVAIPLLSWVNTRRPKNAYGVLALSLTSLSISDIERRGVVETDEPTDTFGASDFAYTLGYGVNIRKTLAIGAAFKFITQTIDSTGASAYALDAGAQYHRERLSLGSGFRNAGSAVKFRSSRDPLPVVVYAGAGYALSENWTGTLELHLPRDDSLTFALGTEYRRKLIKGVTGAVRGGYNTAYGQADGPGGVTLGLGATYGRTSFDFAWLPYGDLGATFRYSLLIRF